MERYWICYVKGTDGGMRYKHFTLEDAETEAERLAKLTGRKVDIYEWKGSCQVGLIKWNIPRTTDGFR